MDHEYDVQITCDRWCRQPPNTNAEELCRRLALSTLHTCVSVAGHLALCLDAPTATTSLHLPH